METCESVHIARRVDIDRVLGQDSLELGVMSVEAAVVEEIIEVLFCYLCPGLCGSGYGLE